MTAILAEPAGGDWRAFELMFAIGTLIFFIILMGLLWVVAQIVDLTVRMLRRNTEILPKDDSSELAPTREDPSKYVRVPHCDEPPDEM